MPFPNLPVHFYYSVVSSQAKSAPHWNAGFKRYHGSDIPPFPGNAEYFKRLNGDHDQRKHTLPRKIEPNGYRPRTNGVHSNGYHPYQVPSNPKETARPVQYTYQYTSEFPVPPAQSRLIGLNCDQLINVFYQHHGITTNSLSKALEAQRRRQPEEDGRTSEEETEAPNVVCVACNQRAAFWCSVCKSVAYCSMSCQVSYDFQMLG